MAGLVLSIGKESQNYFKHIKQNFENLKCLGSSFEYSFNGFHLVKYRRMNDNIDNNYYDCDELNVSIVGSALYKNFGFDESAKEIGKSFLEGENISKIVNDIDGHYFISIFLKKRKRVYLITDCGGVINTYLLEKDENIYISTSMLALAKTFTHTPDDDAILTFIRSGVFFSETTYFKEISLLKPASIYKYELESGRFTRNEYWSVPTNVNKNVTFLKSATKLIKILSGIFEHIPVEKSICDFTGGYDSRFLLSFVLQKENNRKRINAFYFGPPKSREAKIVEKNCQNLKIKYNNFELSGNWSKIFYNYVLLSHKLSDGMINACEYASVLWVQQKKTKKFQYSIIGLFGELYRNFTSKQEFLIAGHNRKADLQKFISYRVLSGSFTYKIFTNETLKIVENVSGYILDYYKDTNSQLDTNSPNSLQLDNIYFAHRMRRWGGRSVTTTNQLLRPICPLWFKQPLSIVFSLSYNNKAREKIMRYIVENIAPDLAKEKTISGAPFLTVRRNNIILFFPSVIFYLKKAFRKFSEVVFKKNIMSGLTQPDYDISLWYKQALKDQRCIDLLDWEKMITRDFYDKQNFNNFIQQAKSDDFHYYGQLGNMLTVELTLRSANLKNAATN